MIVLDYDRGTSYDGFMEAEEFVRKAYDELWNELAMEKLGRPYSGLSDAEKKAIRTAIPMNVCEFRAREVKYPLQGWMKLSGCRKNNYICKVWRSVAGP